MMTSEKTKTKPITRSLSSSREVKALGGPHDQHEVRQALNELMRAFEAFKDANNERLAQIDRRLASDVVTEEKMHRINDALDQQQKMLDEFALEQRRPPLDYAGSEGNREHKRAFDDYIRKGLTSGLDDLESKSSLSTSSTSAGYIVPESVMIAVNERLLTASPMRRIASVQEVSTTSFKKLLTASGPGVEWANSETQDKEDDFTFSSGGFVERSFKFGRLVAMPAATQMLLDDAAVDLERWLADEIYIGFAEKETEAFVKGESTKSIPKGFLRELMERQSGNLASGKIGYIASGKASDWPVKDSRMQKLLDMVYALKAAYRANAHWVMNKTSIAAIRTWVDGSDQPLWQPPVRAGELATLLDYPVVEVEEMPNKNTSNLLYPIAFGDWSRGYLIADRMDMRILRDPYSKKPNVLFYTTKTIGGGVMDHGAIKLMKCATN